MNYRCKIKYYLNIKAYFFKGTVPWGTWPAPLRASVGLQATRLYAEISSIILQKKRKE